MTDELDLRLAAAFRSLDLPAADPRLAETLHALRVRGLAGRKTPDARSGRSSRVAIFALAASVIVAIAVVVGLFRGPSMGPAASPSPTPAPTSGPSPTDETPGWPGYTVATLLAARAAGQVAGEQVLVLGWWTDMRPDAACGTPSPSPLLVACGDGQFGLTEDEEPIGTWDGDAFIPTDGPALTPLLPAGLPTPGLGRSLIGLTDAAGDPHPPVSVTVVGRFDDPRAATCPAELRQACRDRFVIDEIIWAEVSAGPRPTPDPSATAPAPDAPPPAAYPDLVELCRAPRGALEPGDPARLDIVESGWLPFGSLDVQPGSIELMAPVAPAWVYVAVTEPDVPLGDRRPDPAGSALTFRYIGQAVCIGWDGMSGMFHSTVPGTTYELWSDGHRVDLGEFPPPAPSPGA